MTSVLRPGQQITVTVRVAGTSVVPTGKGSHLLEVRYPGTSWLGASRDWTWVRVR